MYEKRPGWDWTVYYLDEGLLGQEELMSMTVFGAMTVDEALRDARRSFSLDDQPTFVGIERQ